MVECKGWPCAGIASSMRLFATTQSFYSVFCISVDYFTDLPYYPCGAGADRGQQLTLPIAPIGCWNKTSRKTLVPPRPSFGKNLKGTSPIKCARPHTGARLHRPWRPREELSNSTFPFLLPL